jgi:SAM-dependent methyltransferase
MTEPARVGETAPERGVAETAQQYKRDFWSKEAYKFSRPWYRLDKLVGLITRVAPAGECALLDVGCGPATLGRLIPARFQYYGIDIAIQEAAPNLREADLLKSPVDFDGKRFDLVVAQGVFEYLADAQGQKFAEIAKILKPDGKFILTYTNFGHRKKLIYEAFSNVQSIPAFRQDLARYFKIESSFPVSYNWKHGHPSRKLLKALNMRINADIPLISSTLAVEYFFVCSALDSELSQTPP